MVVVKFEQDGAIGVVTLNRPDVHNAINPEMTIRLADLWQQLRDDDTIRAVVVTGAGEQAFCAGADLVESIPLMSGARAPETEWDRQVLADLPSAWRAILRGFNVEKPVIAAVNGLAVAGGMELLLATDIRVACDEAVFGLQEVRWGLFPAGGSTARLPAQVPYPLAMEILLTGDLFSAGRAQEIGLVNYVTPRDQLMPKAMELARKIAENGPYAVRQVLKSARECLGRPTVEGLEIETELARGIYSTEDAREGPKAFKERRKPVFVGR